MAEFDKDKVREEAAKIVDRTRQKVAPHGGGTAEHLRAHQFTSDQDREKARENGRKGGLASGAAKKAHKALKEALSELLDEKTKSGKTNGELILESLVKMSISGNVPAVRTVLEVEGSLKQKQEVEVTNQPPISINIQGVNLDEE
jgi:general stress protein YciG